MKELVHWSYYGAKGLFSKKNDKEMLTKVYLIDERGRELVNQGHIAALTTIGFNRVDDPYFKIERQQGFTPRAQKYGDLKRKMMKKYPDLHNKLKPLKCKLADYGDYIYLDLAHIDNYVNPIVRDNDSFLNVNFIHKKDFNKEFLLMLMNYKPQALMGGTIDSFQKEEIPEFMVEVKSKFPQLYKSVLEKSERLQEVNKEISYVGKKAKVKTLKPGKVEVEITIIDSKTFMWNGETLSNEVRTRNGDVINQSITPSDDTVVIIIEDDTVDEFTEFIFD